MVITVIAVRVMEVTIDQVVNVVAVGNRRVAAVRAVLVSLFVSLAAVLGRACGGVRLTDRQSVLFHHVAIDMMQVTVVQIIDMAVVHDAGVAAVRAVLVGVPLVMMRHDPISLLRSLRRVTFQLEGMRQRVLNQVGNVPICQCVEKMIPISPSNDQALRAKNAKSLRDCREFIVSSRHDFGHAQLALLEQFQNPQPRRISHGTK